MKTSHVVVAGAAVTDATEYDTPTLEMAFRLAGDSPSHGDEQESRTSPEYGEYVSDVIRAYHEYVVHQDRYRADQAGGAR